MLTQPNIIPFLDESSENVVLVPPDSCETPYGNTGSKCQKAISAVPDSSPRFATRLHWLQGTFRFFEHYVPELLATALARIFDDSFALDGGPISRGTKFHASGYSVKGVRIAWNLPSPDKPGFMWLSFPGSIFDCSDICNIIMLFDLLTDDYSPGFWLHNFKATRIDLAIDDFSKTISPRFIHEIAKQGNFSGFRNIPTQDKAGNWKAPSYRWVESPWCDSDGELHQAGTINFGSCQSDKQFYVYDKWAESDGKIDSIRFEARFLDEQADIRFREILKCLQSGEGYEDSYCKLIGSMACGAIDFVDRETDERLSRCLRFEWWGQFIDELGRVTFPVPRQKPTIEKVVRWAFRQWKSSFAIFFRVCGLQDTLDCFMQLIDYGEEFLKPFHKAIIAQASKENFNLLQALRLVAN